MIAVTLRRCDVKCPFCGRVQIDCFRIVVYSLVTFGVRLLLVQNDLEYICWEYLKWEDKADKVDKQGEETRNFVFLHKICNSLFITLLVFSPASNFKILATFLMMKRLVINTTRGCR